MSSKPRLGAVGLQDDDDLVQGIVVMLRGENPDEVIAKVKDKIADLNERILPEDVLIEPFIDRTDLVQTTVKTVSTNLLEGIILVSVIVFVFLFNWRTTVIVETVISLSFIFTLFLMWIQRLHAYFISMGAV